MSEKEQNIVNKSEEILIFLIFPGSSKIINISLHFFIPTLKTTIVCYKIKTTIRNIMSSFI